MRRHDVSLRQCQSHQKEVALLNAPGFKTSMSMHFSEFIGTTTP